MKTKQLAEMIKSLRKKKLEEQDPKSASKAYLKKQQFKPVHAPDPYHSGKDSPNAYVHRESVQEAVSQTVHAGLGGDHKPRRTAFASKLGNLRARSGWQTGATNQKRTPATYGNTPKTVAEEEQELDKTKTGEMVKKKKTETINLEPQQSDEKIF